MSGIIFPKELIFFSKVFGCKVLSSITESLFLLSRISFYLLRRQIRDITFFCHSELESGPLLTRMQLVYDRLDHSDLNSFTSNSEEFKRSALQMYGLYVRAPKACLSFSSAQ